MTPVEDPASFVSVVPEGRKVGVSSSALLVGDEEDDSSPPALVSLTKLEKSAVFDSRGPRVVSGTVLTGVLLVRSSSIVVVGLSVLSSSVVPVGTGETSSEGLCTITLLEESSEEVRFVLPNKTPVGEVGSNTLLSLAGSDGVVSEVARGRVALLKGSVSGLVVVFSSSVMELVGGTSGVRVVVGSASLDENEDEGSSTALLLLLSLSP